MRQRASTSKGFRRFVYDSHVSLGIYAVVFLLTQKQYQEIIDQIEDFTRE